MRFEVLSAIVFSSALNEALASPWGQEEGAAFVRLGYANEEIQGVSAERVDAYAEIGLGRSITAALTLEQVDYDQGARFDSSAWRAALQRRVFQRYGFVGSLGIGALKGAAIGGRRGCERLGAEFRSGIGWSGQIGDTAAFSFLELATRQHSDCSRDRIEFGFGQNVVSNLWLVSQYWSERGDQDAISDKAQTDLVWRTDSADLSLSYREELSGAFEERGLVFAIAAKY